MQKRQFILRGSQRCKQFKIKTNRIAGPPCLTHILKNLIDILLRPNTNHVKSNLRDTTDFLNNLPETVPPHTILATFDIEAIYSNILHDLGLEAVKYWLEKYPEEKNKRCLNNFILEAIKLILENNTFCFNNDFFKQIKGTAMETKFARVYATLSIGHLEAELYEKVTEVFGNEFGNISLQAGNDSWMIVSSH